MNINPKVSILMAIYNESILELNASLNSILSQTYKNLEIIIVNDNPKRKENVDFFKEIKDERVVLLTNETNFGLVNSLNRALSIANGDLIARMDADDIAMPNRIEKQVAYLIENQLDLIGANICHINENGDVIKDNVLYPEKDKEIKRLLPYAGLIAHPTWLGRKEVFQVLGGYRQISWCEDYDFIVRAKIYGFKFGNIQEVLLKYRVREQSISRSNHIKQQVVKQKISQSLKQAIPLDVLNQYIKSKKFERDVDSLEKCERYTKMIKQKQIWYIPLLLCNKFMYIKLRNRIIYNY